MPNIMKKILHLSHTDIRYDSRILKEMITVSKISNVDVYGIGVFMDEGNAISTEAQCMNIQSINLYSRKLTFLWQFLRHFLTFLELTAKMLARAYKVRPNIIHSHDVMVLPLAVLLKILLNAKLVYDAHELESNRNGLSPLLSKATLLTEKALWPWVNALITVSPSIERWYHSNLGYKASAVILNSPVIKKTPEAEDISRDYLRKKFNIPVSCKIFIYVGILGKGRGIELFLDIFSRTKNAHLVFLGYGVLSSMIEEQSKNHHNIHFHSAVKHNQVVNLVKAADVGVCLIENVSLSDYFCLPNKLFEYTFAGVPVIASNFPDIAETVHKYGLGVCCDEQLSCIEDAVNGYISGNFNYVVDSRTIAVLAWEAQADKLTGLYRKILIDLNSEAK